MGREGIEKEDVLRDRKIYNISTQDPLTRFSDSAHPMQAQYNTPSSYPSIDYYHPIPNSYPTQSDQYFATSGGDNFVGSFSRGSSLAYPHEDYRFLTDRGGPSSVEATGALSSTSFAAAATTNIDFNATGLGFAENTTTTAVATLTSVPGRHYCHSEEIPAQYKQAQGWQWENHTTGQATLAPHTHSHLLSHLYPHVPTLPQLPAEAVPGALPQDAAFLDLATTIKSAVTVGQSQSYLVRSPTAQLPTPAAMAVLLNPSGRRKDPISQVAMEATLSNQQSTAQMSPGVMTDATAAMPVPDMLSREKKHACTMCHKRFDRPSTLRKHLLVHTGEKAFVCDTCGRRFGVASNLNRHVRRCILKPVNATASSSTSTSGSPLASGSVTPSTMPAAVEQDNGHVGAVKRGRALSSTESASSSSSTSSPSSDGQSPNAGNAGLTSQREKQAGQKRRRRAPSPSLWVPWSLRTFNLVCEELYRSTPAPLPPVRRNVPREERDSWDQNISSTPYHPQEWKGVLPGPGLGHGMGLGGKDVRNINFGGSGGIMLGRVLVF